MHALDDLIQHLTDAVVARQISLDRALAGLDEWLPPHASDLSQAARESFRASLTDPSTGDDRALVGSVLKLHAARLLHRFDRRREPPPPTPDSPYAQARAALAEALTASEDAISEARIDIAIASAQHLLGDEQAHRRWLSCALDRLPAGAAVDLVALAEAVPDMPPPRLSRWQRAGMRVIGLNFDRLSARNRADLSRIAQLQTVQCVLLAHLLGATCETAGEGHLAGDAYRVAADLVRRRGGLPGLDTGPLLDVAESLRRREPEAAALLATQARDQAREAGDADAVARAEALLDG